MLHLEELWAHDAYFSYVDWWMTEDDEEINKVIAANGGMDYSKDVKSRTRGRQGDTGSKFIGDMWGIYRNNLPPAADGHKDIKDSETWE